MAADGYSYSQTAKELNYRDYRNPRTNSKWTPIAVKAAVVKTPEKIVRPLRAQFPLSRESFLGKLRQQRGSKVAGAWLKAGKAATSTGI